MITKPIIPIVLMSIICVVLLVLKRKGIVPYIRQIIMIILIFCINLNLMIPNGTVTVQKPSVNLNVIFVIDDSISINAEDYDGSKTRLEGVKEVANEIAENLYGARFAIITFDNEARVRNTFTRDMTCVKGTINSIASKSLYYAKGTSMNPPKDLLGQTIKRAKDKDNGGVVVFFFSDGEVTNGEALESYASYKNDIDGGAVLGFGTDKGGKMQYYDSANERYEYVKTISGKDAVSVIDEKNLKQIASDLGVKYIHTTSKNDVSSVINELKSKVEVEQGEATEINYKPIYYVFAIPLALLLAVEFFEYRRKAGVV